MPKPLVALAKFLFFLLPAIGAAAAVPPLTPQEWNISQDLPFADQVKRHIALMKRINEVMTETGERKTAAIAANSLPGYLEAEADMENVKKLLAPYAVAEAKVKELVSQGYKLNAVEPKVCKAEAECVPIDAITEMFFFTKTYSSALGPGFNKEEKDQDPVTVNGFPIESFFRVLADKPLDFFTFGLLPAIRDAFIPPGETGEIALLIRDPGKRTVEIVQNLRDGIVPKSDNGEGAKILRDPINCTIGRFFKRC
ncbi:hypothetical protein [Variovorax sp. PMC12]|uniref:hypothetical protein n=1 Tax=Variovorax sp. PMC12 TaxID=2126319 RepID=UPI00131C13E4|nr:hypothetical protein [Variovorax sp. PMC12]